MSVTKINTDDDTLSRIQDNLARAIDALSVLPLSNGLLLIAIPLASAGVTKVSHKLGRIPQGYIPIDQNAQSTIWTSAKNINFLELHCSADVTVSLYVF